MASVLPKKATWIKDSVATFDPYNNKVTTASGDEISYEFLVVAMGLQLRYENVKGLVDALQGRYSILVSDVIARRQDVAQEMERN